MRNIDFFFFFRTYQKTRNETLGIWIVDTLIDCLNEEKCQFKFKGLDFETDLVKSYSNIRKKMSESYTTGKFRVISVEEIVATLSTKEFAY